MQHKSLNLIYLILVLVLPLNLYAQQDIKNVNPQKLSEAEIKKVEKAIKDSGLSFEEAAAMARQRGASEQQIREMQQRLMQSDSFGPSSNVDNLPQIQDEHDTVKHEALSSRKAPILKNSPVFGSYLFNNENLTFEPSLNVQTPKNYEIGIGDQIIINIWGNSQNNYQLIVNNNGQIMIPDIGPVFVAGLTFDAAESKIKHRLTDIYADIGSKNPQTFAQINLGRLRSITVNLVGEVETPGTYTLPVTATVFNALYLSGGPNKIGSFRNIRVIRDNQVFKTVDVYDFLLNGQITENIRLRDDDIIFVPPAQTQVEITGQIKRKGVYEMTNNEKLMDLIDFAGGFTDIADWSDLQIYRKTLKGKRIIDVPFEEAPEVSLQNGDVVLSGEIIDTIQNRVTITGSVMRPGEYQWSEGMSLLDLINKADSLKGDVFTNRGNIIRLNQDFTKSTIPFNLQTVLNRENIILLQPEDVVIIKSLDDLAQRQVIAVSGEVLHPDTFIFSKGITLADAIFRAGGFTEAADSSFIEVARRLTHEEAAILSDEMVHIFTLDLSRDLIYNNEDAGFKLKPFDRIFVRRAPGFRENASAIVSGEVKYTGYYAIQNKNQRISDLLEMAGGLTEHAFLEGATFARNSNELGQEYIAIDLEQIINNPGGDQDLYLRDGDYLHIPQYIQTVKVSGSVHNPFSVNFQKGKSLKYYIDRCGGFENDALKRDVYVKYPNGATATTNGFLINDYPKVTPGSEIIVPEKEEKQRLGTGQWLAIASTFSSIAVAVAAIFR